MSTLNSQAHQVRPLQALVDLIIFLGIMFLVRTFYIESIGFWGNTLFKTASTVLAATFLLKIRGQTWKDLGVTKPDKYYKILVVAAITVVGSVLSIMLFESFIRDLVFGSEIETGPNNAIAKEDNFSYFFLIIIFVWIESFLEELQDRGFSLNRIESLFSKVPFSTLIAVLLQAAIFGFRHSYDLSPRSITTGLIGLAFGVVYVLSGRNLWPLILAHIFLNTISMINKL